MRYHMAVIYSFSINMHTESVIIIVYDILLCKR